MQTVADHEWGGGDAAYVRHLMNHGSVLVAEMGAGVAAFGATEPVGAGPDVISMLCDLFVDPAAGWAFDDSDLFMATDPSFLDARRAVVSPSQA